MTLRPALRSTLFGTVSGFLTRPCCIVPAAMSFAGVGSARLSSLLAQYHGLFLFASASLLGVSCVVNFRRDGGGFNKALTVIAALIAFIAASGWIGAL